MLAAEQAKQMGVEYHVISIEPAYEALKASLQDALHGDVSGITSQNLQARIRGVQLMALSNKTGKLLLSTGNKSEVAVGYATLYGDMAGGYAPLRDVLKTLVYRLAEHRNALSPVIPAAGHRTGAHGGTGAGAEGFRQPAALRGAGPDTRGLRGRGQDHRRDRRLGNPEER